MYDDGRGWPLRKTQMADGLCILAIHRRRTGIYTLSSWMTILHACSCSDTRPSEDVGQVPQAQSDVVIRDTKPSTASPQANGLNAQQQPVYAVVAYEDEYVQP